MTITAAKAAGTHDDDGGHQNSEIAHARPTRSVETSLTYVPNTQVAPALADSVRLWFVRARACLIGATTAAASERRDAPPAGHAV